MNAADDTFGTMNIDEMESVIDRNTICIIGSAPCYPYSVTDDIEAICAVASYVLLILLFCALTMTLTLCPIQSVEVQCQSTSTTVSADSVCHF